MNLAYDMTLTYDMTFTYALTLTCVTTHELMYVFTKREYPKLLCNQPDLASLFNFNKHVTPPKSRVLC